MLIREAEAEFPYQTSKTNVDNLKQIYTFKRNTSFEMFKYPYHGGGNLL